MQIYILDGNRAVTRLADKYALYLPDEDELLLLAPYNIVYLVESMYEEETPFEEEVEVNAYLYHLRGDMVDYSQDIWNSILDTVEELRDMFGGRYVEYGPVDAADDGTMYMDHKTDTMKVRIDGQWLPIVDQ